MHNNDVYEERREMSHVQNEGSAELKDIRLEVRLSATVNEQLEQCSNILKSSKGAIIRRGIEKMYEFARQKKALEDTNMDIEQKIKKVEMQRRSMVYEQAYEEAYREAYNEKYFELISDMDCMPSDARSDAADHAEDVAAEIANDAVNDYFDY